MIITPNAPYDPSRRPRKSLDRRRRIRAVIGWIAFAALVAYLFGAIAAGLYRVL